MRVEFMDLANSPQLRLLVLCVALLALNMLILAIGTVVSRASSKKYLNPEDSKVASKEATVLEGPESEIPGRFVRAHRNAVENIPLFCIVAYFYVLTGGSLLGARAYFITFTAARFLHAICYVKGLQPWRTLIFAVGFACILGMTVHLIRVAV